jgi:hydroxypyruvate reductase
MRSSLVLKIGAETAVLQDEAKPIVVLAHPPLVVLEEPLAAKFRLERAWMSDVALPATARVLAVAGEVPLDQRLLERLPRLEYIACVSTGYDGLDLADLRRRGLKVSVARDVNATDVADHAVGRILCLYQSFAEADRLMKAGQWAQAAALPNQSLLKTRLGIVGLGGVGRAIAERSCAFGMRVAWWGPNARDAPWPRASSLIALAEESDVLVVAARADGGNEKLISADVIAALGCEGRLVNVARGRLVDEDALIAALKDRRLAGAALDVFETEPTPADRWRDVPNVILTPHMAGRTREALQRIVGQLIENLDSFFAGRALVTEV